MPQVSGLGFWGPGYSSSDNHFKHRGTFWSANDASTVLVHMIQRLYISSEMRIMPAAAAVSMALQWFHPGAK